MHRHGYQGRKLRRDRDQRRALIKGLADSLVLNTEITTTLPKAKEVVPYVEKLITKAKKGDLHSRRQIIGKLHTIEASHKLVDEIAPKLTKRSSGHLRITKLQARKGDNTPMAKIAFVDKLSAKDTANKPAAASKTTASKKTAIPSENQDIPTSNEAKRAAKPAVSTPNVRKRRGIRGNR